MDLSIRLSTFPERGLSPLGSYRVSRAPSYLFAASRAYTEHRAERGEAPPWISGINETASLS